MEIGSDADPLLIEVERFLSATKMTATAFGQRALNDPTFVHELRKGRECKRATRTRILDFIQGQAPQSTEAAA